MRSKLLRAFTIGAIAVSAATMAHAQQQNPGGHVDVGKYEYDAHCATCHGLKGEGNGPYAGFVIKGVPNLATLSKSNGSVFPFARVYNIIDGRQEIPAHGSREMPIWGSRYKLEAGDYDFESDSEAAVRGRILTLTEYVYRLQAK